MTYPASSRKGHCYSSFSTTVVSMAEKVSCYSALFLALMLAMSLCQGFEREAEELYSRRDFNGLMSSRSSSTSTSATKPCDEIYVVGEGETLQSISDKCGDPYIVEENPHIHDPDDVFPGLVIKITPYKNT